MLTQDGHRTAPLDSATLLLLGLPAPVHFRVLAVQGGGVGRTTAMRGGVVVAFGGGCVSHLRGAVCSCCIWTGFCFPPQLCVFLLPQGGEPRGGDAV